MLSFFKTIIHIQSTFKFTTEFKIAKNQKQLKIFSTNPFLFNVLHYGIYV